MESKKPKFEILDPETIRERNERGKGEFEKAKQQGIDELFTRSQLRKKQIAHLERLTNVDEELLERYNNELIEIEDELSELSEATFEPELETPQIDRGTIIDIEAEKDTQKKLS